MKIGLDTESCHLLFHNGLIDIIGFIKKASDLGLDGVMINIIGGMKNDDKRYIDPDWGCLGSAAPEHLDEVRKTLEKYNMYAELAMRGIETEKISEALEVARRIGADLLRTYCCFGRYNEAALKKAPENFKKIVPLLKKYRIRFAVENHEEETSEEILRIIKKTDSPWIGSHCDIGNSMMAWEDPVAAVEKLAPYAYSSHFKDHIIIEDRGEYKICGVPLGQGNIDIEQCLRIIFDKSVLARVNIEQTYPFLSVFKREKGTGGVSEVGEGAFKVEKPVFNFEKHDPDEYYYPPETDLQDMIKAQEEGLAESVKYMKMLRDRCSRSELYI